MSSFKWIVATILGLLSLHALADPLRINASASGIVTTLSGTFPDLGGGAPGEHVVLDFEKEVSPSSSMVDGNTFTLPADSYFENFGIGAGGRYLGFRPTSGTSPESMNTIQLQDNVRNAAGDLVDVFELSVNTIIGTSVYYTTTTHLEYAPATFGPLDEWSILAVRDAPMLRGTIHLHDIAESWDGTFRTGDMMVEVNDFAIQFAGPGAVVPAVPEPVHGAMLLAGLAGVALMRRRSSGI